MSQPDRNNPFVPPQVHPTAAAAAALPRPASGIEYLRSYNYVFENPDWGMNLLWGFLCLFSTAIIPILGQLVFMGYQFEVIDGLLASRGARYPNFDINRFGEYLGRSIWPFLVNLIATFVLLPVFFVLIFIPIMILVGAASAAGEDAAPVVVLIGIPMMLLVIIPLVILPALFLIPMMFRAGMTQNFGEGFNFGWVMDFVKKTWLEMFLGMLFLALTGMVLAVIGMVLCYLPMFAAAALIMLAQAHLMYQFYMVYLSKGGQPLPIKPVMPPPTWPPQPQY